MLKSYDVSTSAEWMIHRVYQHLGSFKIFIYSFISSFNYYLISLTVIIIISGIVQPAGHFGADRQLGQDCPSVGLGERSV